jgi:hypothetical protein
MNPYVAGLVASDGHIRDYCWLISQSHKGVDVLWKILKFFPDGKLKRINNHVKRYSQEFSYNLTYKKCKGINPFEDWKIPEGKKSYILEFPNNKTSDEIFLYLRGYFDGDGSIGFENNKYPRVQIISNRLWCEVCEKFLQSHNIRCYLHDDKRHVGLTNLIIRRINSVHNFFDKIYENDIPLFLDRKYYRWLEIKACRPRFVNERRPKLKLNQEDLINIEKELLSGERICNLEEKYRNEKTIYEVLKNLGGREIIEQKQEERILNLIIQGETCRDLVKAGHNRERVHRIFKGVKNNFHRQGIPLSSEIKTKIINMLNSKMTARDICHSMGINKNIVYRIDRDLTGGAELKNKKEREIKKQFVKTLILKGLGRNEIYEKYHIGKYLIQQAKEELNVKFYGI